MFRLQCVNSLWPNGAIWQHKALSTLAQVMAWCLASPSHYLNQCWLINRTVQWHLPTWELLHRRYISHQSLTLAWNIHIWNLIKFSRGQWVKDTPLSLNMDQLPIHVHTSTYTTVVPTNWWAYFHVMRHFFSLFVLTYLFILLSVVSKAAVNINEFIIHILKGNFQAYILWKLLWQMMHRNSIWNVFVISSVSKVVCVGGLEMYSYSMICGTCRKMEDVKHTMVSASLIIVRSLEAHVHEFVRPIYWWLSARLQ